MATVAQRAGSLRPHALWAGAAALVLGVIVTSSPAVAQEQSLEEANAWVLDQINAPAAWETTRGKGVTVAVIDAGMGEHPYFDDKDVLRGHSLFNPEEEDDAWYDIVGHGMAVAAAVLQVAPEATILPVRNGNSGETHGITGDGWSDIDSDAIRLAVDGGANVIVMSWGIFGTTVVDEDALEPVQYAIDRDVVVLAASGNDPNLESMPFPASIPGVIAVSGTDRGRTAWEGSTTGPETVLAAPADDHRIPLPQAGLSWGPEDPLYEDGARGTSFATGFAAGAAALVRAAHPDLDANNVIQRLIATADDLGTGGRTESLGFGLVDADAAVHATDIAPVDQNPLGYPLGAPGLSDDGSGDDVAVETPAGSGDDNAIAGADGSLLLVFAVIATGSVLVAAVLTVWLTARARRRKRQEPTASMSPGVGGYPPSYGQPGYSPQQPGTFGPSGQQPPEWGGPGTSGQPGPHRHGR